MHVFLTGNMQIGKTTLINKTIEHLGYSFLDLGGFRTMSMPSDFALGEVYIVDVSAPYPECNRNNLIGIRWGSGKFTAFPSAFELYGASLVRSARGRLLLMDEIGVMESEAPSFCHAILEKLKDNTPVLGVIKPKPSPLLDAIRHDPRVCVIEVREDNRNHLSDTILEHLKRMP